MERQTLTLREVCSILDISDRTARTMLTEQRFPIPHLRIGNQYRFSRAQVDAYLAPKGAVNI